MRRFNNENENGIMKKTHLCPICCTPLQESGPAYSLEELFALWEPIQFSKEVVNEHREQAEYTQMFSCAFCKLDTFLPQIVGTPNFYIELQKKYPGSYYTDDKWDFEEALKDAKKVGSIIEIGCGPGAFLEKAKPYVKQVFGVEYNEQALNIARSKGLTVFGVDDVNPAEMKGQFDAAFSFHVLEHVTDPVGFIREMLTWVKPCGLIGLSVPNMDGPLKFISPCIQNMPPHHATRWKLKTFEMLAEKLGLKIERVVYEPLGRRNSEYYSYYWVRYFFSNKSLPVHISQFLAVRLFELIFRALEAFNKKYFGLLKGQSIYLLMSRAN